MPAKSRYHAKPCRHKRVRAERAIVRATFYFFYSFLSETTIVREVDPYKVTSKTRPATPRRHHRRHHRRRRRPQLSLALDREDNMKRWWRWI